LCNYKWYNNIKSETEGAALRSARLRRDAGTFAVRINIVRLGRVEYDKALDKPLRAVGRRYLA
jgi:hypothetical protein